MTAVRAMRARALLGHLARRPGRTLLSVVALALGVALGVAVSVVNRSALEEFGRGLRAASGEADLVVRGARTGFDEALYPRLAMRAEVDGASPLLEIETRVRGAKTDGGADTLKLIGLDPLRAIVLSPALVPPPAEGAGRGENPARAEQGLGPLDDDVVYLSPAAARRFGVARGDTIELQCGGRSVRFRIGGLLPAVGAGQLLAVTDIATAQWRFDRLGQLTRIDLRLAEGAALAEALRDIGTILPAGVFVALPEQTEAQAARLSRAYRVNLSMLALIALATGAFLVFSAQALSVVRRRSELAFLRAVGLTRGELLRWLLLEGLVIGALGSLIGAAGGYGLAALALRVQGGDLGAGYFQGAQPALALDPWGTIGFVALGIAAALAGSAVPAFEAARSDPAQALKSGDAAHAFARGTRLAPGLLCLSLAALVVWLPPVAGLPVFGYASIALLLVGSVMILPWLARRLFRGLPAAPRRVWLLLAIEQLRGAPHQASIGAAGVLAAVALAGAMAIMVGSFRQSVDVWLGRVLPADLYLRAVRAGESGHFELAEQAAILATPGVLRVDFLRHRSLLLDPSLPQVALIARPIPADEPEHALPLLARATVPAGQLAVLASEAMQDLYGWRLGQRVRLPLAEREVEAVVAGIWRDYARQHGAVAIDLAAYRALTGDMRVNDAGLWLAPQAGVDALAKSLRARLPAQTIDLAEPGEIRKITLGIFDRTFAVTYALEAVAIVIGIAGVGASFAALASARRREFGMLRHIGMTRGAIARMLGAEGALVAALGVMTGLASGTAISLILIHVVNRQSFHWSMELVLPWRTLALFGAAMTLLATAAAVLSARAAMQVDAVRAVREDW